MTRLVLNVGGARHETSRTTLTASDSFFRPLVAHSLEEELFVDRDPTHFRHVLNYLRGSPSFPPTEHEMNELRAEADFYCLGGLKRLVDEKIRSVAKKSVAYQIEVLGTKLQR